MTGPIKWLEVAGWSISYGVDELVCSWILLIGMFWLSGFIGCAVGLCISAGTLFIRQKGEVVAVLLVILVTLPQILFSDKMVPERLTQKERHFYSFDMWHETAYFPELCSFFTVSRYLFLPLDAEARGVGSPGRIFAFNLTVLGMFAAVVVASTWTLMETYAWWQRRCS